MDGVAVGVRATVLLTLAGNTGTGGSVDVGIGLGIAGAIDTGVGCGVPSVGVTISDVGGAGWSNATAVAAAAASVASTTPVSTIRRDHRPSSAISVNA
jgi:hypothetical protein